MNDVMQKIEAVVEEKVRPVLQAHGGDLKVDRLEGKVLYVNLLGQCSGCPSADFTNETIIEAEVVAALPELVERVVAVHTVSDELWEQAKRLIREGPCNMAQISDLLHFDNPQYFSKCFKAFTNMTPSEYKTSILSR